MNWINLSNFDDTTLKLGKNSTIGNMQSSCVRFRRCDGHMLEKFRLPSLIR